MTVINPEKISDFIIEAAETFILPRYQILEDHEISTKTGPRDLVTQADIDVENHLKKILPDLLPGSIVIGEESVSENPELLDVLQDKSQKIWIVDPVDGTHNFVHHKREFGVMLACVIDGETQYGWIYDILGREMLIAEKGSGAYSSDNRLKVTPSAKLSEMTGHINPWFFPKEYRDDIKAACKDVKSCKSLACAAHEYLNIAKGKAQFLVYSRLKPWDHLPGCLITTEAGGVVAQWDGSPYTPQDYHTGLLVAASQEDWQISFNHFLKYHL